MSSLRTERDLSGVTVLVVEDDYYLADDICRVLKQAGARIVGPAPDVETGLELIRKECFDCAVLDINLRGIQAFELAESLHSRSLPYAFTTAYDSDVIPRALRGAKRLEKPTDLPTLVRTVAQMARSKLEPMQ